MRIEKKIEFQQSNGERTVRCQFAMPIYAIWFRMNGKFIDCEMNNGYAETAIVFAAESKWFPLLLVSTEAVAVLGDVGSE